ncbi:glutaredoxin 3 [Novosphingobium sp.]|jgi:glutaredoxin 3|uniref:glutaredoxin 3 n=1 Tax=Novosphingobium sp. TaxID=1874826 RepID=UPI00356181B1|nr:glutaredoxin 3 [Novosphingobium sp.]
MSNTPKVEIYTKWGCPYCFRAKALLDGKGVTYEEFDVTMGGPKKAEMMQRAPHHSTVPSIFIDGAHIGGSDDMASLDASGKLDAMLAL